MKNKKMIHLTIATTLLLHLSGCGGSDSVAKIADEIESSGDKVTQPTTQEDEEIEGSGDKVIQPTTEEDEKSEEPATIVEFKTEGTYDFSNYLFSLPTLTPKMYALKTYTDDTDPTDTVYGTQLGTTSFYAQTLQTEGDQRTYDNGETNVVYTLLQDRIQSEDETLSTPIDIVRYANNGDYLSDTNRDLTYLGSDTAVTFKIQCQLKEQLASKNDFSDVLQVVCSSQNGLYRGEFFYAKDRGSILEVNSLCTQNTADDLNCTNVVVEYRGGLS